MKHLSTTQQSITFWRTTIFIFTVMRTSNFTVIYESIYLSSFRTAKLRHHLPCYICIEPCLYNRTGAGYIQSLIQSLRIHLPAATCSIMQHSYKLAAPCTCSMVGHVQCHKNENYQKYLVFSQIKLCHHKLNYTIGVPESNQLTGIILTT
jgi:hypothetical protein